MWGLSETSWKGGDLTGRVALVTGGNAGMGFAVAEQLAVHGAKVYMAARSESKAGHAIRQYQQLHGLGAKGSITWLPLDLSSVKDVRRAVEQLRSLEQKLDILVNSAGQMMADYALSEDQLEMSVSVNHMGHFALTTMLLPLLRNATGEDTGDVRVVTISSGIHSKISRKDLGGSWDMDRTFASDAGHVNSLRAKVLRYAYSKLLNILFATELQRRCDRESIPIISMSINPGLVATDGALELYPTWLRGALKAVGRTPLQGANAALFAAIAPEVGLKRAQYRGSYLNSRGEVDRASDIASDAQLAAELWEVSKMIVSKDLGNEDRSEKLTPASPHF
ncbi:hypothetical protein BDW59DRAFT_162043 [Aspergillus cavernicola]|uniref:Short-chain dehydrogenase n=1 Tax=Aspergillus cavernicola TaxID=176166 RepID=A0ABR4IBK3_9EURO